jgi:two-component system, OmpR family, response regulator MtrA
VARVLVCDDDPGIRELLVITLSLEHEVLDAANGRLALETLRADGGVEAIVLDVMMPEMDGFATLAEIRADPALADLVVLMLTARVGDADVDAGYAAGADAYLTKPFDPEELERSLATALATPVEERRELREGRARRAATLRRLEDG